MIDEIKALSLWHEPLLDKTEEELEEMLKSLQEKLAAKEADIENELGNKISALEAASQKDCGIFQELIATNIYPYVAGQLECNELHEYMDCCIKIELGEKTEGIMEQIATAEQQIKCRSYRDGLVTMKEVLTAVTDIKALPGFQNCIREYVTALIESCKLLISQDLMASQRNFHTCVALLQVDRELDDISRKPINEEQFMAVAHSIWFKLEKWKAASPPNVKWLDLEACNTGAAIYKCWEAYQKLKPLANQSDTTSVTPTEVMSVQPESTKKGTESEPAKGGDSDSVDQLLIIYGLKELFVRYFSYRDRSCEWAHRARQFVLSIIGLYTAASTTSTSSEWRRLVLQGIREAWVECISDDELITLARHDSDMAAEAIKKQQKEAVPLGGQYVDILVTRSVALTAEAIDRVIILIQDPTAREKYLDIVLKQGIVETTAQELKAQWNAMPDAFDPSSLSTAMVILNSISYAYTAIMDFKPVVTDHILKPLYAVLQRVVYLFGTSVTDEISPYDLNHVADSVQNAIDKSFLSRVQKEVFLEGTSLILQVIAKELMDMVTTPSEIGRSNLAAIQAYIAKSIPPTKRDVALQLTLQECKNFLDRII